MKKHIRTLLAIAALGVVSIPAYAEIIWAQPSSMRSQNLSFQGNATMKQGDVRELQRALAREGFYKGRVDGIWGGRTTQALLDYQAYNNMPLTGTVSLGMLRDMGVRVDARSYGYERRYSRHYDERRMDYRDDRRTNYYGPRYNNSDYNYNRYNGGYNR